ncbi:hypothetical protein [Cryobacterium sp. PH31-O1]|uniref:hypothetical protein n=1 Tax=Cryobacterium sp. PH31-O1 TaxID=3046306 RepID=UPI0024BBB2C9|nr:hypothetical protein [Cryobacterium sp. PH31-O1]MDJ0338436.1 hypothetical protein [Cryobacterium sp. PH31-O1]
MTEDFNYRDLFLLTREVFGDRMSGQFSHGDDQTMGANLYDALPISCVLNPVTKLFSATILVGASRNVTVVRGGQFGSAGDRVSVLGALRALDESCRLRLPDVYLAKFDVAFDRDLRLFGPRSDGPPAPSMPHAGFYELALDFFGARISLPTSDKVGQRMAGVLYDSFLFSCGFDDQRMMFGASIRLSPEGGIGSFMGRRPSMRTDRDSLAESLRLVDEYCRLRLPEKFLTVFDAAHGLSRPVLEG